jgi:hypothetical protein
MLSQEALEKILGIEEKVSITAEEMADKMNVTFFPHIGKNVDNEVFLFVEDLKKAFNELKVNVVPYDKALEKVSYLRIFKRLVRIFLNNLFYFSNLIFKLENSRHYVPLSAVKNLFKRYKVKKGISIIAIGENETWNLPMDNTISFSGSFVITIVNWPKEIKEDSKFVEHFDVSMKLFAHHMTNIVIAVKKDKWILYNFNASHPIYGRSEDFRKSVLHALIPKVVAPIRPYKFSEFIFQSNSFDSFDEFHKKSTEDLINGSKAFENTNLYPPGKKISDLPFRNKFYEWIGRIHLDERSGMSFGFFARQLPTKLESLIDYKNFIKNHPGSFDKANDFCVIDENIYILIDLKDGKFVMKVPDIWVLSLRSGCNKTNFDPKKDIIKIGLKNGRMYLCSPNGLILKKDYKPSFDTKVILAHAVGNAIIASILNKISPKDRFVRLIKKEGLAMAHWHGYFHPDFVPKGWVSHGILNPHVSCSSPQSAIYAIDGKLRSFLDVLDSNQKFFGDIHIEPHHGTNIMYPSLLELANFLSENKEASILGNKYLDLYN